MCGIAGFWDLNHDLAPSRRRQVVTEMALQLKHRGPDSVGCLVDDDAGMALGHARLAIIDLSPAGAQPMASASGRCVIAYNGEIYNAGELAAELKAAGRRFRGHSDTEVLLEACEAWGVVSAVRRCTGMFAFAFWDRRERKLWLVRDRVGIKPLYWGVQDKHLLFGSELKGFSVHPNWRPELDHGAFGAYLRYGYVPTPLSIYKGIRKLKPGVAVEISADGTSNETTFWALSEVALHGISSRRRDSSEELITSLEELLTDAVRRRMVADVPLGALLSGGIDSSTVVSLMQRCSTGPVKTFSVGFEEQGYDETRYARVVAEHLGTEHHEMRISPDEARSSIPRLPEFYDEPFGDSSQIPAFLVSSLARNHVTVALSGDGGDEVFAGYNRYFLGETIGRYKRVLPPWMRELIAAGLRIPPPGFWDRTESHFGIAKVAGKVHRFADALASANADDFYERMTTLWPNSHQLAGIDGQACASEIRAPLSIIEKFERMQFADTLSYLPDDILTKVDRASMAVSLEVRVPLLDHRVIDFAWSLPISQKITATEGKKILRRLLSRHVPKRAFDRPKSGFAVPIHAWLRGPLRDWAEALISKAKLEESGFADVRPVRDLWQAHLAGRVDGQHPLWAVLMYQAWWEHWMRGGGTVRRLHALSH